MRQASLSNGLRIGAIEMPGVRHVSIRLIVGAGSRDEPREKAGINHFVEHLSFAARSAIPTRARFAPASRRVASMGATMNAHITEESTTLEVDVSAGHVRPALQLIAQVLLTPYNIPGIPVIGEPLRVRRFDPTTASSTPLMRAGSAGCLTAIAIAIVLVACGGKIAPSSDDLRSQSAVLFGATVSADPAGSGRHAPGTAPVAGTPGTSSARGSTYVNGPLGFVVQDAFSFDTGPSTNRELRGIWLTSFTPAYDKTKAVEGSAVLRIDFSEQADTVPPGTYPLEGPTTPDKKTAYAQVWFVTAAGCSTTGVPGAHFESGTVTITRSDATGMVGSFQGVLLDNDGNAAAVDGHFDAPRCPTGGGACTP